METSTFQKIRKKAGKLFDHKLQTGWVLEVRQWEPSTLIEVDLHLPMANIAQWNEVPYIKFKVDDLTFRDYTPSGWDAETCTCTIYVDAAHHGPGSRWSKQLKKGDTVNYLKIGTTHHKPVATSAVVALGDESSMGHLLALQKMVLPDTRFSGSLVIGNEHHRRLFHEYFWSPLEPVARKDIYGHHSLMEWVLNQHYSLENTVFYLAGNNTMVAQLRKLLKHQGYPSGQIKLQGFWS
ncbi:SIP domain-containing protein [Mucilaginibacter sabulilitoris]|uniref:SIP domain-containing protein n=1 Tax=Mucilaginibacter sabulilitoris TaxID=1173583 RepID=A0ABZ0TU65_9SPHI|nr:SIP domain-containing protein [Mucilaginibacter sabulilitoris]WPU95329.1 SIP domain-containing protein [Mucilaginibacter sabulilitoris]